MLILHRIDETNLGDFVSSPLKYFKFDNFETERREILEVDKFDLEKKTYYNRRRWVVRRIFLQKYSLCSINKKKEGS